ncbi:hypothetical protein CYMTET_51761 [Cymbomonas tetramitiformis]|uniref:Uncharacterized protein n=1 Tax=Cymbomonas tetramitiformis TaxID=36881 RepID=A0AAE0ES06_9CHLO|nr:hypothetical protein CYMTET_51761 [Cymbomonas tetramitiformis]
MQAPENPDKCPELDTISLRVVFPHLHATENLLQRLHKALSEQLLVLSIFPEVRRQTIFVCGKEHSPNIVLCGSWP